MKILLTGSTGFIGSHVLKKINKTDNTIYCMSRAKQYDDNWVQVDLLNKAEIEKAVTQLKPDILIHLAWDVEHGKYWHNTNNADYKTASINLFKSFIKNGGHKIIAAGTCAEYPTSNQPVAENMVVDKNVLTPYGRAKREVCEWLENNFVDFTWCRLFGIYGAGEHKDRLFPSALKTIRLGRKFKIDNPNIFSDYIHADDFASFIEVAIQNDKIGVINLGTGKSKSLKNILDILNFYLQHQTYKEMQETENPHKNSRIPNCQKLKSLGFNFNWENGIKQLLKERK